MGKYMHVYGNQYNHLEHFSVVVVVFVVVVDDDDDDTQFDFV